MPQYLHETIPKERALEALIETKESLGWQLICDWVECANVRAVNKLGSDPRMTTDEMHFHRGSISAAGRFSGVVDQMTEFFRAEVLLAQVEIKPKPKRKRKSK